VKARIAALIATIASVAACLPLIGSAPINAAPLLVGRVHETFQPEDGKIFVLVIGNDARSGNPDNSRADAIHIAGINTKTMKGGILNFPRDSWVSIPGAGTAKMNEALYRGGPNLLASTLENLTGIRIDYWAMVGFDGFRGIVDDIGGVRYKIPQPVYDPTGSGAKLDPGKQWLGPLNALAFVRTRHSFAGGDVDRTTNQAKFLLAMLRELRADVAKAPARLMDWMATTKKWAKLNVSNEELFRLAVLTSQVKPGDIGNVTVPVSLGSVGAASVVFISSGANSIYQRFRENGSL
jgi:polyisoprenyl-teichoic acid--peptidoglycan teichoic acid transferase